ncbi:MAG: electron transfer flavoprotein subunit alpha [Deltaproteobacteria bacterium]|nr:electron transfer flavoprotein subunit alpha [Deltaproteobacteria bacterium]
MESILFLAHSQSDGTLPKSALEALSAALEVAGKMSGGGLSVGLIGDNIQGAADAIAACGAQKFLAVEGPEFSVSRYGSDAAAAEALVRQSGATLVLAPGTSRFSRSLPGVNQRLNGRIETHVSGLDCAGDTLKLQRWYYRKRMEATLTRSQRPWFVLVDAGVFPVWEGEAGSANLEKVEVALDDDCKRTQVVGVEAPTSDAQTIRPDAELLFVAGAGWTKKQADGEIHLKDAENLILGFLQKSKASLGSSKSLVDQSCEGEAVLTFMSHLNQVGQTGATPRHPKGLATCCHGEEPHVVGWRFINERRAISIDPNCGWAIGKADVLYVADAFEVIAKVNEILES